MSSFESLQTFGMKKQWLYEIVVSSYSKETPNSAPFGVRTTDYKTITIEMYKGSATLKSILKTGEFAVNVVEDPVVFYNALYCKEKIHFSRAKMITAPVIVDSPASIEVKLTESQEKEKSYIIEAEVIHIDYREKCLLTNRAKSLALESLILSTRKNLFPQEEMERMLRENYRVVKKVAPESKYEKMVHTLLTSILK
jgi:hypothetical protein